VCGVFLTVALSCFVFPIVCPLKYLLIERHLAAKTGTNLAVSDLMGSFSRRYIFFRVLRICVFVFSETKMCKMTDEDICCICSCFFIIIVTVWTLSFSYQLALQKIQTNTTVSN
jgi:hypothetical protein